MSDCHTLIFFGFSVRQQLHRRPEARRRCRQPADLGAPKALEHDTQRTVRKAGNLYGPRDGAYAKEVSAARLVDRGIALRHQ